MEIRRRLRWIFRTEKINVWAFKALEIAFVYYMMGLGEKPKDIRHKMEALGRYMGDLIYIGYHAQVGDAARDIMDLGRVANEFYMFLFGEGLDKIYYRFADDNTISIHLISFDGFPTCREISSPHPEIKFGSFIMGGINRVLEIKKEELQYMYASCWEDKCIATGDDHCEAIIRFIVPKNIYREMRSRYGDEYHVK